MKIVAYALAFLIGPTVGTAGKVPILPVLLLVRKNHILWIIVRGIGSVFAGILTIWIGRWIFSWFGYPPTLLMAAVITFGFVVVDIPRLRAISNPVQFMEEIINDAGYVAGMIVGIGFFVL